MADRALLGGIARGQRSAGQAGPEVVPMSVRLRRLAAALPLVPPALALALACVVDGAKRWL
jgi:hypothetical protein